MKKNGLTIADLLMYSLLFFLLVIAALVPIFFQVARIGKESKSKEPIAFLEADLPAAEKTVQPIEILYEQPLGGALSGYSAVAIRERETGRKLLLFIRPHTAVPPFIVTLPDGTEKDSANGK
jgi:hypothetical protein